MQLDYQQTEKGIRTHQNDELYDELWNSPSIHFRFTDQKIHYEFRVWICFFDALITELKKQT